VIKENNITCVKIGDMFAGDIGVTCKPISLPEQVDTKCNQSDYCQNCDDDNQHDDP